ncbi:MAG: calcium/sodium antiporter [Anaerolineae bacterium]|nr:calcium/sodium antiporter [Anaerolineae bacterium]
MNIVDVGLVAAGLVALFFGGDWLVQGAARLAQSFRIAPLIIGLTVVAVGTSAPELLVSVQAALQSNSQLALGNVIGSNIANIGLILGLSALIAPCRIQRSLIRREIPLMIAVTVLAALFILDGDLTRLEGAVLLIGFGLFNVLMYRLATQERREHPEQVPAVNAPVPPVLIRRGREAARLLVGLVALVAGAQWLITGAVNIARALDIPELVIGLTMVALGTSLPELATSVIAALRGHSEISFGNVVGSNIANLLLILGLTVFIAPFGPGAGVTVDVLVMVGLAFILLPFALRQQRLSRLEGGVLLLAYAAFIGYSLL